jgi:hypothetical protein
LVSSNCSFVSSLKETMKAFGAQIETNFKDKKYKISKTNYDAIQII